MDTLTRKDQVLRVLGDGGSVVKRRGLLVLKDQHGNKVPAWQQAIKAAQKGLGEAS